jgi:hypothetical protein
MSLTVKASFSVTGLPEGKGMSLPIMAGCALAVTILTFGGLGSVQNTVSCWLLAEASMGLGCCRVLRRSGAKEVEWHQLSKHCGQAGPGQP